MFFLPWTDLLAITLDFVGFLNTLICSNKHHSCPGIKIFCSSVSDVNAFWLFQLYFLDGLHLWDRVEEWGVSAFFFLLGWLGILDICIWVDSHLSLQPCQLCQLWKQPEKFSSFIQPAQLFLSPFVCWGDGVDWPGVVILVALTSRLPNGVAREWSKYKSSWQDIFCK